MKCGFLILSFACVIGVSLVFALGATAEIVYENIPYNFDTIFRLH
jgi:hypothetical protein